MSVYAFFLAGCLWQSPGALEIWTVHFFGSGSTRSTWRHGCRWYKKIICQFVIVSQVTVHSGDNEGEKFRLHQFSRTLTLSSNAIQS